MHNFQQVIKIKTHCKGLLEITGEVQQVVKTSNIVCGICNLFISHTSASLVIQENADLDVQKDMEYFFGKLVPENDIGYTHTMEGPDDMPAHIKSSTIGNNLTIPISEGKLSLGTWQGIYLCEHRNHAYSRKIIATINGQKNS